MFVHSATSHVDAGFSFERSPGLQHRLNLSGFLGFGSSVFTVLLILVELFPLWPFLPLLLKALPMFTGSLDFTAKRFVIAKKG